jgi:hypothetical protein
MSEKFLAAEEAANALINDLTSLNQEAAAHQSAKRVYEDTLSVLVDLSDSLAMLATQAGTVIGKMGKLGVAEVQAEIHQLQQVLSNEIQVGQGDIRTVSAGIEALEPKIRALFADYTEYSSEQNKQIANQLNSIESKQIELADKDFEQGAQIIDRTTEVQLQVSKIPSSLLDLNTLIQQQASGVADTIGRTQSATNDTLNNLFEGNNARLDKIEKMVYYAISIGALSLVAAALVYLQIK